MTPIINPWWFYLFNLVENLGQASTIVMIATGIITLVLLLNALFENMKIHIPKPILIVFIIATIFTVITPSKETCYQMAAATLVTPDNLAATGEAVTDIIDYIVESVDEVLDDDKEE